MSLLLAFDDEWPLAQSLAAALGWPLAPKYQASVGMSYWATQAAPAFSSQGAPTTSVMRSRNL